MGLIYTRKIGVNENMPAFLPGMCCANFQGSEFPFLNVDVSRLQDLSGFFSGCSNLLTTPMLGDLTSKTGLDTAFEGCAFLREILFMGQIASDISIYSPGFILEEYIKILNSLQPQDKVNQKTLKTFQDIAMVETSQSGIFTQVDLNDTLLVFTNYHWRASYKETGGSVTPTGDTSFVDAVNSVEGWRYGNV